MIETSGASPERAIIFDLDGTLVDSAPDIHDALSHALSLHGAAVTPTQTRSFIGRGAPTLVARAADATGLPHVLRPIILAEFLNRYDTAVALSRLYPGALDALDALRARGHSLAICTNKPIKPTRFVLAHFGLDARMAAVIGGDSLDRPKPDPAPLRAAMDGIGVQDCLFVGDSETDCETARNAGVPFLLFTEGYRHGAPDTLPHRAKFDDWSVFPDLVRDLLSKA